MFGRVRTFGDKLMLLVAMTTGVAVALVTATHAGLEGMALKPRALAQLETQADVIATHSTAALSFDDPAAGAETLGALLAVDQVVIAVLYDQRGKPFATYRRAGDRTPIPAGPSAIGHRFDDRRLWLTRAVSLGDKPLGSLLFVYELDREYREMTGKLAKGALVGIGAIALALALASQLRHRLARPVTELTRAAASISTTRDYTVRAQRFGDDELAGLTDTFNHMLDKIEQFQQEQASAEQRLRRNAEELERSIRELDEFAYIASHDLKSPLQGIKSLAGWIEEDNADALPDKSRRHLQQMQQRVTRLEALLDDLLQYSRAGRVARDIDEVDTAELLRNTTALLSPPDGVRVSIPRNAPVFTTARVPLEQVFRNLINNAIKHHDKPEARIAVACQDQGERYEFSVADDGPGIDAQFHARIFQMFETLTPRDKIEGSGMGLAVIKKIVESFGGEIRVESAPGEGAVFRFTWPKSISPEGLS